MTDDEVLPSDRPSWIRRHWHELAAVLVAAMLRLPGVFNGLPYVNHPDEPVNYDYFHRMVYTPTVKPGFYVYPSLQYDIQAGVHWTVGHVGKWFGMWHSMADLGYHPGRADGAALVMQSEPWMAARMVTLIVTCLAVFVAVRIATRLTASQWWGLGGGLLLAVSTIGIVNGKLITPDALAGTTALLVLAWLLRLLEPDPQVPGWRWVVGAGAMMGLALGSKYNNGLLFVALGLAVWLALPEHRPNVRQLVALTGIAGVVFLITTPAVFLDTRLFIDDVKSLLDHYGSSHAGADDNALLAQGRYLWPGEAITLVGAVAAVLWSRRRPVWLLAGWVVGYVLLLSVPNVHFARNLTPVLGALAVLGAVGGQQLWWRLRAVAVERKLPSVGQGLLLAVLVVATLVAAGTQLWRTQHEVRHDLTDHQALSRDWLEGVVPTDAVVLAEAYSPWLDRGVWTVNNVRTMPYADPEAVAGADVLLITSTASGRFEGRDDKYPGEVAFLAEVRAGACDIERFDDGWGYWVEVIFQRCD